MTHRFLAATTTGSSLCGALASFALAALSGCASDVRVLRDHATLSNGKDAGAAGQEDSGSGGAPAASAAGGSKATSASGGSQAATGSGGSKASSGASPMDLYLMLDQSSSMDDPVVGSNSTWWTLTTNALRTFLNDPSAIGTGVGLQYFPLDGIAPASCAADYSTPEVEIAPLPGNITALSASLAMHAPNAFTPTAAALRGAINHMKAWAPAHPGRVPAVVFVTDGFPTECEPQDITDVALIAAGGVAADPVVKTFVIGLNLGGGAPNLDELAAAGGTGHAIAIDHDVTANLIAALTHVVASTDHDGG